MKYFIKNNLKILKLSFFIAFMLALVFVFLHAKNIIPIPCRISYLNPWQYFFHCDMLPVYSALLVFVGSFFISYFLLKIMKLLK